MATKTLTTVLNKVTSILQSKISKADYYLAMCERVYTPSDYDCVSNFSGVTISDKNLTLSGNMLLLYLNVTMTSTAQTKLGTGNVTNNCIATFTINDFYGPSITDPFNNSDRIKRIAGIYNRIDGLSGYSAGTASVATFDIQSTFSILSGVVTIKVYTAAIQAKTSNFRIKALIPVRRMRWNPDGGTV